MTHSSHPNTLCSSLSDYFLHCCVPTPYFKRTILSRLCGKCSTLFLMLFLLSDYRKKEFHFTQLVKNFSNQCPNRHQCKRRQKQWSILRIHNRLKRVDRNFRAKFIERRPKKNWFSTSRRFHVGGNELQNNSKFLYTLYNYIYVILVEIELA